MRLGSSAGRVHFDVIVAPFPPSLYRDSYPVARSESANFVALAAPRVSPSNAWFYSQYRRPDRITIISIGSVRFPPFYSTFNRSLVRTHQPPRHGRADPADRQEKPFPRRTAQVKCQPFHNPRVQFCHHHPPGIRPHDKRASPDAFLRPGVRSRSRSRSVVMADADETLRGLLTATLDS